MLGGNSYLNPRLKTTPAHSKLPLNTNPLMALAQNAKGATVVQQLVCPAASLVTTYSQTVNTGRLNVALYVTAYKAGRMAEGKNNPFRGDD